MDREEIRALAEILNEAGLTRLEIKEGELEIKLYKEQPEVTIASSAFLPNAQEPIQKEQEKPEKKEDAGLDFNQAKEITSPMVGVFYAAASPEDAPFVQVGSQVKAGDVLCIVEAMKLFNEIKAKEDGEIIDICAADGDVVEFGQVLFKIV